MKSTRKFYNALAQEIQWYKDTTEEYKKEAEYKIRRLEKQLPSGSGFDNGSSVNLEQSTGQKIVIDTAFHHMDKHGYYDGWTDHKVIVTPCLQYGYQLKITGKNREGIKNYMYELFNDLQIN